MVSGFFVRLVYFLGLTAIVLSTAAALYKAPLLAEMYASLEFDTVKMVGLYAGIFVTGLLVILIWRFVCELFFVIFGIFNQLGDIKRTLQEGALNPAASELGRPRQTPSNPEPISQPNVTERPVQVSSGIKTLADEKPDGDAPIDPLPSGSKGWRIRRRRR
jgi:hypothetical protein